MKKAFVIMPFVLAKSKTKKYRDQSKDELDTVYELFRSALEDLGYETTRSSSRTDIIREIVFKLDQSDLVLADLTSLNPNVMYELGVRHAFCKKTILVTQDISEIPFDLKAYATLEYGWDVLKKQQAFRTGLHQVIEDLDNDPDPRYGPVHSHLGAKDLAFSDFEKKTTLSKLDRLAHEIGFLLTGTHTVIDKLPEKFPKNYRRGEDGWEAITKTVPNGVWDYLTTALNPSEISTPCIDLLLSTGYVNSDFNKFGEINQYIWILHTIQTMHYYIDRGTANYYTQRLRLLKEVQVITAQIYHAVKVDVRGMKIFELPPDFSFIESEIFPDGHTFGQSAEKHISRSKEAKSPRTTTRRSAKNAATGNRVKKT